VSSVVSMLFVLAVVGSIALQIQGDRRCREHIQGWAAVQGLAVASVRRRWFFFGSFFFTTSRSQRVYDVAFVDAGGMVHPALVRVGGWFVGALSDRVDVRWRR
jgi:hypothetical protein